MEYRVNLAAAIEDIERLAAITGHNVIENSPYMVQMAIAERLEKQNELLEVIAEHMGDIAYTLECFNKR